MATKESVVALIEKAEQSRIPSHQCPIYRSDKYHHPIPEPDIMNMSKGEKCQYVMPKMKLNEKLLKLCKLSRSASFNSFNVFALRIQFSVCVCVF